MRLPISLVMQVCVLGVWSMGPESCVLAGVSLVAAGHDAWDQGSGVLGLGYLGMANIKC